MGAANNCPAGRAMDGYALSEQIIKPKLSQGRALLHGKTYFYLFFFRIIIFNIILSLR